MPVILGHEVAGAIEKLGSEVREFRRGDLVATTIHSHVCGHCRDCRNGHETSCPERVFLGDAGLNGGYAELVCVDADAAVKVPAGVSMEEASIVACTIGTELNAVREVGRVPVGERVLVTGAGGGLGLHGVQLSRLAGAFTIAVTTTAAKAARIREAGADEVIVIERGADFSGEVRRITDGRGVDAVIDNVGSQVFEPVRRSVADGGRIVLVGSSPANSSASTRRNCSCAISRSLSAKGVSRSQLGDALDLVAATPHQARGSRGLSARWRRRGAPAGRNRPFDGSACAQAVLTISINPVTQKEPPMPQPMTPRPGLEANQASAHAHLAAARYRARHHGPASAR